MEPAPVVIWLIGARKTEAREHQEQLMAGGELEVRAVPVRPRLEDYADLAANPETGVLAIGEGLLKRSGDAYGPLELAAFFRSLRPELPIYLLADDPDDDPGALFEGVLVSKTLRKHPEIYSARLLRAAGRYRAALERNQRRLQTLLDRQMSATLTPDEVDELVMLRADTERAAQLKLAKHIERSELDLAERRNLVEQLETLAERIEERRRGG